MFDLLDIEIPPPAQRYRYPDPSSAKCKNMREKVMDRNRMFHFPRDDKKGCYRCDICLTLTNKPSDFINSHIVAKAHAKNLASIFALLILFQGEI